MTDEVLRNLIVPKCLHVTFRPRRHDEFKFFASSDDNQIRPTTVPWGLKKVKAELLSLLSQPRIGSHLGHDLEKQGVDGELGTSRTRFPIARPVLTTGPLWTGFWFVPDRLRRAGATTPQIVDMVGKQTRIDVALFFTSDRAGFTVFGKASHELRAVLDRFGAIYPRPFGDLAYW